MPGGKISIVVGAQFGSEGKGHVAGYLAKDQDYNVLAMRVGGSNAGHTVVDDRGHTWRLRHIPVAAVTNRSASLALAQDTILDWEVFRSEALALDQAGYSVLNRIWIDQNAVYVTDEHKKQEADLVGRIGSTGKGIGAATAARAMRQASILGSRGVDTGAIAVDWLSRAGLVLIEGAQGFGLGLSAGWYPWSTSRNCRAIDVLAGCGLSPWHRDVRKVEIWLVARVYPIRVSGASGDLREETTWEALELPPERTTVTNRIRRVGLWDSRLVATAVAANGGGPTVRVCLTMLDQKYKELADETNVNQIKKVAGEWIEQIESEIGAPIRLVGVGPNKLVPYP